MLQGIDNIIINGVNIDLFYRASLPARLVAAVLRTTHAEARICRWRGWAPPVVGWLYDARTLVYVKYVFSNYSAILVWRDHLECWGESRRKPVFSFPDKEMGRIANRWPVRPECYVATCAQAWFLLYLLCQTILLQEFRRERLMRHLCQTLLILRR